MSKIESKKVSKAENSGHCLLIGPRNMIYSDFIQFRALNLNYREKFIIIITRKENRMENNKIEQLTLN